MSPNPRPAGLAESWWGRAWIDAIEHRTRLDPSRLPQGRAHARGGHVGPVSITPGRIDAEVQGTDARPHTVAVTLPVLSPSQWDALLDAVATKAGHVAALLDGSLLPEILDDGRRVGIDLLPGPGALQLRCTCPDQTEPCPHAAAVCYAAARALDDDPFALLHLRGRRREEVWADLQARRRPAGTGTAPGSTPTTRTPRPGVEARDAYDAAADRVCDAEALWAQRPPHPPHRPGHPPPLAVPPPPGSGIDAEALRALALDSATRAWHLLRGDADATGASALGLSPEQDLARRAAPLLDTTELGRLAQASGVPDHHLVELALAWRLGGTEGTSVLTEEWDPDPEVLDDGRDAMLAVGLRNVRLRIHRNRITAGPVQLRVAPNGAWYRFEKAGNRWDLVAGPAFDPLAVADPDIDDDEDRAPASAP